MKTIKIILTEENLKQIEMIQKNPAYRGFTLEQIVQMLIGERLNNC